jgi:hypothetical protein
MPQAASIDNFLDAHRANSMITDCGKLAIARCILDAESSSLMRADNRQAYNRINFRDLQDTWYNSFFQMIVQGCQLAELPSRLSSIAIVTFNYDRCIEQYLHCGLRNYYGIEVAQATDLLRHLTIYHPYGHLGDPGWSATNNGIDFGADVAAQQLVEIANRIKTFTEGTDESSSDIVAIRATIAKAERLA